MKKILQATHSECNFHHLSSNIAKRVASLICTIRVSISAATSIQFYSFSFSANSRFSHPNDWAIRCLFCKVDKIASTIPSSKCRSANRPWQRIIIAVRICSSLIAPLMGRKNPLQQVVCIQRKQINVYVVCMGMYGYVYVYLCMSICIRVYSFNRPYTHRWNGTSTTWAGGGSLEPLPWASQDAWGVFLEKINRKEKIRIKSSVDPVTLYSYQRHIHTCGHWHLFRHTDKLNPV